MQVEVQETYSNESKNETRWRKPMTRDQSGLVPERIRSVTALVSVKLDPLNPSILHFWRYYPAFCLPLRDPSREVKSHHLCWPFQAHTLWLFSLSLLSNSSRESIQADPNFYKYNNHRSSTPTPSFNIPNRNHGINWSNPCHQGVIYTAPWHGLPRLCRSPRGPQPGQAQPQWRL